MQDKTTSRDTDSHEQALKDRGDIVEVGNGIYKIYTALNNSSLVDMSLNADSYGTHNVKLHRDNNEPASTWRFFRHSSGPLYQISNGKDNSLLLGKADGDHDYNVIAEPAHSSSDLHTWLLTDAGDGFVYINNFSINDMMDVAGANTADGTNILLSPPYQGGEQKFKLVKVRDL